MRIVSWTVILGSSLALYLGGIRPMAEQWRAPIGAIWSDLETNSGQLGGAMIDPATAGNTTGNTSVEECSEGTAADAETPRGESGRSNSQLCLESAVARQ